MNPSAYVCVLVILVFPFCTRSFEYFSSSSFSSSSSHSNGQIHRNSETVIENGKEVHFCSYKGMKFLPGSTFTDYEDCYKCECTEDLFSCYSMEADLKVRSQSNGNDAQCVALKSGCETEWVLKKNHSINCGTWGSATSYDSTTTTNPFGGETFTTPPDVNGTAGPGENSTDLDSFSWF